MRFAIDGRYLGRGPSGIGRYVGAIVRGMLPLAPDDAFDLWVHPGGLPEELGRYGQGRLRRVEVRTLANSPPSLLWPRLLGPLGEASVFHAPSNLLGLGIPCPTVVTIHDLMYLLTPRETEPPGPMLPLQVAFYGAGIRQALRRATRIVSISRATAESIRLVMPELLPRVRTIVHGIEERFRPPERPDEAHREAARALGSDAPYLLVVGQNAPYKNHGAILEAYAASRLAPGVRLVFLQRSHAGRGLPARARALGLEESVLFRSGLTESELLAVLQSALGLVQFSRFEGFGMPVLEAFASGTPVLASDIPALVEVSGGAAAHVPLLPAELASAMRRLALEPRLREELSARGLERARAFSWARSAQEHLEVYREAARAG